jgi:hypothetical protein
MNTNFGMTPDQLAAAGRALYGERWQTSLAADLHVVDRTMRRWLAGETSIPDGLKNELRELLIKRVNEIDGMPTIQAFPFMRIKLPRRCESISRNEPVTEG